MRREGEGVAVVVAATGASEGVGDHLRVFADEVRGRGEVVLVDATSEGFGEAAPAGVRVVRRSAGSLAPDLWRDGLRATEEPLVAFTTAAMAPEPGWLDALIRRLEEAGAAGVGGPIAPGESLGPTDRAVYLLRYVGYMPPRPASATAEPPGDNALYRRDRLAELETLIEDGFWEAEVHRALRARGEALAFAEGAVVRFHGGEALGRVVGQRFRHGRRYGAARGRAMNPVERIARAAAAPVVPVVLAGRAASALGARGEAFGPWTPAAPRAAAALAAWAAGEACGLLGLG